MVNNILIKNKILIFLFLLSFKIYFIKKKILNVKIVKNVII